MKIHAMETPKLLKLKLMIKKQRNILDANYEKGMKNAKTKLD